MIIKNSPKVSLVGAGPGDTELLTLKALKTIEKADIILYDALVNPEILDFSKKDIPKIFVGKRAGYKSYSQEEINQLIVNKALEYGHVVRLKGGDAFVFGRGKEEQNFIENFGIDVEVIPGISSSLAVPMSVGIPVTHRGASNSFWVLSGTLKDGSFNKEIIEAAKSNATVVILMGINKISEIIKAYSNAGKSDELIAIISNGTLENQREVVGRIYNIQQQILEQKISSPATIVIGKVVEQANWKKEVLVNNHEIIIT